MTQASTAKEIRRLASLPTKDLLKRFAEARDELSHFLDRVGLGSSASSEDSDQEAAGDNVILLDEFNRKSIATIDNHVRSVYGVAGAFLKLFEQIPRSTQLPEVMVSIEGKDTCSAIELKNIVVSGFIGEDSQISIDARQLRQLLPDFDQAGGPESEPAQVAPSAPAPSAAETSVASPETTVPEETEPAIDWNSLPSLPVAISQEDYMNVMGGTPPIEKTVAPPTVLPTPAPVPLPTPSEDSVDESGTMNQAELDALFGGMESSDAASDSVSSNDDEGSLNQSELDALFGGGGGSKPPPAPESSKDEGGALSQSELDALFGGGGGSKPPPAAESSKDEGGALNQSELDALFGGGSGSKPPPAAESSEDEGGALNQSELDALFGGGSK